MSELRDLTSVFRAIHQCVKDIGEVVANQEANLAQVRKNIHELRGELQTRETWSELQEKSLNQIHTWMGDFSRKQVEIHDSMAALQSSISSHRKEINSRIKDLESPEEVTRP